jgi:trimeric autotransporter adhesin
MGLVERVFGICRTCSRLELYDVKFGGIERMTKRLTIALIALAIFVLVATLPVSADKVNDGNTNVYYYKVAQNINAGATVFIGEQHLNTAFAPGTQIGWWSTGQDPLNEGPALSLIISNPADFEVPASVAQAGATANWYVVNPATGHSTGTLALRSEDPSLDLNIWDTTIGADVTGKSITQGEKLQFGIVTNQKDAFASTLLRNPITGTSTGDGYIDLKVKTQTGAVLSALYINNTYAVRLTQINVTTQPYNWGNYSLDATTGIGAGVPNFAWATDASQNGQRTYPAGTYTVWAESLLNNMKTRYTDASGAAYTGKTVSAVRTITLVSDTVKITVDKDSVVRSKPFSVTITGRPAANYCVWIKASSALDSALDDQPPLLTPFQAGVYDGSTGTAGSPAYAWSAESTNATLGQYCYYYKPQNLGTDIHGDTWNSDTAANPATANQNNLRFASVAMTSAGTRTVQFDTTNLTKAQKYTIKVEQNFSGQIKSDQVDVKVEKGAVTIVAAGDQSYYLGEEVKFSGTNTESTTTYLFIIGPNLDADGGQLINPREPVVSGDPSTFAQGDVQSDNTWSYKWGTANLALDAGTYTIYAVSQPLDKSGQNLNSVAYGTVSVIIKKPFVSATASQSTVAQGDKLLITGTAEGQPSAGVQIWILGKNYDDKATESVNADSTFEYEIKSGTTQGMFPGQYFVVVQHPMQNGIFDIDTTGVLHSGDNVYVINKMLGINTSSATQSSTTIFRLEGQGSLQGSDAAEALVQAINDPNVDDTYTKLQFLVETGVINIVPIGDKHVGDKFTIKALTNLAVDDEILVQVYSSSFKPTQKSQSGEFSGATGTVKVTKGDSGMNTISFDVDASTFKPDEYIVTEEAVIQSVSGSALFNVLEGAAPTAVPTPVPTTVVPTTVATPVPTPTPTPTPTKSPGYGALIALIGLGAVAFIVVRRH